MILCHYTFYLINNVHPQRIFCTYSYLICLYLTKHNRRSILFRALSVNVLMKSDNLSNNLFNLYRRVGTQRIINGIVFLLRRYITTKWNRRVFMCLEFFYRTVCYLYEYYVVKRITFVRQPLWPLFISPGIG